MEELKIIGWFVWLAVSLIILRATLGYAGLTRMFPEGKRWWHLITESAAISFFGAAAICNPWTLGLCHA